MEIGAKKSNPFALAVSTRLYIVALDADPFGVSTKSLFLRLTVNGRIALSEIEHLNRKVKDIKRLSRGFWKFEHFRNRFLYGNRNNLVQSSSSDYNQVQCFEDEDS